MYTIVIPFWNGNATLGKLLSTLPKVDDIIIAVDKDSEEPKDIGEIATVIHLKERGYFSGAVNAGIKAASPSHDILILNQDIWFTSDYTELIRRNQPIYGIFGDAVHGHRGYPKGYVQGTFMYLRRDAIDAVGLLNEVDYPHWGATCEWQLRACRMGFKANPIKIPMMLHARRAKYGSATQTTLDKDKDKRNLLIRLPPEISIIVTSYNYSRYLQDCLNSLNGGTTSLGLADPQTMQSYEVILVDDGSDKENRELLLRYKDEWKGIKVILRDKRGGTPAALNTGIERAYGKYIIHLAADDMLEPWALEELLIAQKANPHSFIYTDAYLFAFGKKYEEWKLSDYDFEQCLVKNQVHAGILFPKQAWKDTGGYPEEMNAGREDWAWNIRLGINGYCGVHIRKPGYLYRRENQNRSLSNVGEGWRVHFGKQMYTLFKSIYDGERPMGCCGGGRKAQKTLPYRTQNVGLAGKDGMVLVQYLGGKAGSETFMGAVSSSAYEFSARKNIRWVDQRDLITNNVRKPGLLELNTFQRKLFKILPPPEKVKPVTPGITQNEINSEPALEAPVTTAKKTRKKKTV